MNRLSFIFIIFLIKFACADRIPLTANDREARGAGGGHSVA